MIMIFQLNLSDIFLENNWNIKAKFDDGLFWNI